MFKAIGENIRLRWNLMRKRKNLLTDKPMQLRFAVTFTGIFFVVFVVLSAIYLFFLVRVLNLPIFWSVDALVQLIQDQWLAFVCAFIALLALPLAVALSGIVLTHRVIGPFVPIARHLRALRAGDYGQGIIRIRKSDYIHPFVCALNEAIAAMKSREDEARLCLEDALTFLRDCDLKGEDIARGRELSSIIEALVESMRERTVKKGPIEVYDEHHYR